MAFNGSGVFLRLYRWATDATNNVNPNAGRFDLEDDGFAAGLSNCITKDGQSLPTANIPMNGKRLVNVGTAAASTDALTLGGADARYVTTVLLGAANGAASLDATVKIPVAQIPSLDTSQITTGVLPATRVSGLAFTNINGSIANAQVPQSAVTQFQGVLALSGAQIVSGTVPSATLAVSATNATNTTDLAGAGYKAGFLEMPQNAVNSSYTIVLADSGKLLNHSSSAPHTFTIPSYASVALAIGTVIGVAATGGGGTITLAPAAGVTLYWAGTSNTGVRTLTPFGLATLLKVGADIWLVSGAGLA